MARTIRIPTPDGMRRVVVDSHGRPVLPTGPICVYAGVIAGHHRDSLRCPRTAPVFSGVREPDGVLVHWCQACEYALAMGRARDSYGRFVQRVTAS